MCSRQTSLVVAKFLELRPYLCFRHLALTVHRHGAVRCDEDMQGQSDQTVAAADLSATVDRDAIRQLVLGGEVLRLFVCFQLVDADDNHVVLAEIVRDLADGRRFCLARLTPRGEEIDIYGVTLQLRERYRASTVRYQRQRKIWSGRAVLRRSRGVRGQSAYENENAGGRGVPRPSRQRFGDTSFHACG